MQVTVTVTMVFIIQHWIEARTITDEGYWSYDVTDIYATLEAAQTEMNEFYWDGVRTRIVAAELTTKQVLAETVPVERSHEEPTLTQKELFAVEQ